MKALVLVLKSLLSVVLIFIAGGAQISGVASLTSESDPVPPLRPATVTVVDWDAVSRPFSNTSKNSFCRIFVEYDDGSRRFRDRA